jgi:DNA-binding NarL/FixJ family response regulator
VRSISVLVVDDHAVFADAVRSLLETDPQLKPVTVAYGLEEATSQVASLRPDVALVDLQLADGTGIDFARRARTLSPETRVVMMSALESQDALFNALFHGVRVWLPKTVEPKKFIRAVHVAHHGRTWLPSHMIGPVIDALVERATAASGPLDRLSHRELEILEGLAAGKSRKVLANELHLSVNTIRSHVQNVISKLEVHTTLEAVAVYNRAQRS